jgi:hypothetical protein
VNKLILNTKEGFQIPETTEAEEEIQFFGTQQN